MTQFAVTLEELRKAGACVSRYNRGIRALQGVEFTDSDNAMKTYIRFAHKEPIPIISILESNGLDDALWALQCVEDADRDLRMFAVWCARQIEHLMTDRRSINALDVAERFANGKATEEDLSAARDAAEDAARAAASAVASVSADAAGCAGVRNGMPQRRRNAKCSS